MDIPGYKAIHNSPDYAINGEKREAKRPKLPDSRMFPVSGNVDIETIRTFTPV
jgi:hypothetical protein